MDHVNDSQRRQRTTWEPTEPIDESAVGHPIQPTSARSTDMTVSAQRTQGWELAQLGDGTNPR